MKFILTSTVFAATALLAGSTPLFERAAPALVKRAAPLTDTQILQYALTLENLEESYYSVALAKFDNAAFVKAGLPVWARGRFEQIAEHEAAHVAFLKTALGSDAVAPCNYSFPYTDPKSFAALSAVLEGVGTSAYLGAAALLSSKSLLTVAGAVLTTEARHQAWVSSAVNKGAPWSGALDTPLAPNQVFSLAAAFITGCPASNPPLPFTAFPGLTASANPTPGKAVQFTFSGSGSGLFLALFSGLTPVFVPITSSSTGGSVTLPTGLQGTVYAVVSRNGTVVTDDVTLAGPAILSFPFDSNASN